MFRRGFSIAESLLVTCVVAGMIMLFTSASLDPAPSFLSNGENLRDLQTLPYQTAPPKVVEIEATTTENHCRVDDLGTKRWFNDQDQLHRLDGPAIVYADGSSSWYANGVCHREDGPAIDWNGYKAWYLHGERLWLAQADHDSTLLK